MSASDNNKADEYPKDRQWLERTYVATLDAAAQAGMTVEEYIDAEKRKHSKAEPVAWACTQRLSGGKAVFKEPFVAVNPAYVKAHPDHDWKPLHPPATEQEIAEVIGLADVLTLAVWQHESEDCLEVNEARAERDAAIRRLGHL